MGVILLVVIIVAIFYFVVTYNSLVSIKNNVEKAWANIDVLLKQRNDELPKLMDTCKAYMTHEAQTLERVTQAYMGVDAARQTQDIAGLNKAESVLTSSLASLFAVAESYPELKADQTFLNLQSRISGLENQIADRRELYNDSVNINNIRIQQFPAVVVASVFNFQRKELLELATAELQDEDVASRFNS